MTTPERALPDRGLPDRALDARALLACALLAWAPVAGCAADAQEDGVSRSLRAEVESLGRDASREPTTAANVRARVDTLWKWANARALAGGNVPPGLPRDVALARIAAAKGIAPPETLLRAIDDDIHWLGIQDEDPDALGETRFGSTEPLRAASWTTLEQTWTAGSRPLVTGGKVVVGKQLATDQGRYQADDPEGDHYVSIRCSDPGARFAQTTVVLLGMHGAFRGNAPTLAFELVEGTIDRGETVTVTYGDRARGSRGFRVTSFSTDELLLPIYLDLDGGGHLVAPRWPSLRVLGEEEPARLAVFAPTVAAAGERFDLVVRVEDRFWNRVSGEVPALEVRLGDRAVARLPAGAAAVARVEDVRIADPGVHRFEVASADGTLRAASNPVWVEEAPDRRILWGETHVHAGLSEGQGSAEAVFRYALEDSRLDFLGYSEHDIYMDDAEWRTLGELARRYGGAGDGSGDLITFLGYEWTVEHGLGGHHNVFFRTPDRDRVAVQEAPTLPELYRGLAAANRPEDVLVIPHAHEAGDWTRSEPGLERLVEIYSMHGSFEWFGNLYLKRGWRVGFVAASDEHRAKPGHAPAIPLLGPLMQFGGVAAVVAPEKSRDAVFDALRDFSSYATSGPRIALDARLNGHAMGTRQPASAERRLAVRASGTSPIDQIDLVRNGEAIWSRRYLGQPLQPTVSWIQVGFESTSDVFEPARENPRGWRWWEGTLEIEGARLADVQTPGLDNSYEDFVRREEGAPARLRFRVGTRGRRDTFLLRLEGAGPQTTLRFRLDQTTEFNFLGGTLRPAATIPAQEATLSLADLEESRLEHATAVDVHTDRITLQVVDPTAPLDRSVELDDAAGTADGDYYYVRVTQLDGGRAWSSPFWVGAKDTVAPR